MFAGPKSLTPAASSAPDPSRTLNSMPSGLQPVNPKTPNPTTHNPKTQNLKTLLKSCSSPQLPFSPLGPQPVRPLDLPSPSDAQLSILQPPAA
mmetsp:Transcript_32591/g.50711  ORF Transcript_32591/g.50711 Transcript_32591/m.50711 type:complete len:93 (-) Transcript_32591:100-378(-)